MWDHLELACFRERAEWEKALALQREAEKSAKEKEKRVLEEKKKELEEQKKRVNFKLYHTSKSVVCSATYRLI